MEISGSAHKHGIDPADIEHAWENAIRYVEFEYEGEDRLLVIGAHRHGRMLELVRPGQRADAAHPCRPTPAQILRLPQVMADMKTKKTDDTGLSTLEPGQVEARDAVHFRRIIAARKKVADADQELRDAVQAARDAGDSWTVIGAALDTTRQAAFQRFGKPADEPRAKHARTSR